MTVGELGERMTPVEFNAWRLLWLIEREEANSPEKKKEELAKEAAAAMEAKVARKRRR